MNPTVSIVVANYNHALHLPRCLEAIYGQTLLPNEVLVVDDASTDNSLEVLRRFQASHPGLRLDVNDRNRGVCFTLNRGLELVESDYIYFAAADDEIRPQLLEASLRLLIAHPQAGLSTGLSEWRDTATGLAWLAGTSMPSRAAYLSAAQMEALGRRGRLFICNPSAVYKKAAILDAGGWIPELQWHTDWFGAYVVGFRHGICHVPEVLSVFNLAPTSFYHSKRSRAERQEPLRHILRLLAQPRYADVAPAIARSGVLGALGWPVARLVFRHREYRRFRTFPFVRAIARRGIESAGRRLLPRGLARICTRVLYRAPGAPKAAG